MGSDTAVRISCSLAAAMFGRFVVVPLAKTVMAMRTLKNALQEVLKEKMEAMEKSEKEADANESLAKALAVEKDDAVAKIQDAFKAKYPEKADDPWVKRVSLTYKNKSKNKCNAVEEIEKEEDWDIAMPEDGKEDPQDPVGKKKAPSKSPIDIFGEDEDWNIALPTIPEEGKAKKKAPGKSAIDVFGEEEDWDIALTTIPEEGKAKKKSSGKSAIDVFGQDEDWNSALPTIPEGKEDDECAKTEKDVCDLLFAKPKGEGVKEKRSLGQAAAKTKKD